MIGLRLRWFATRAPRQDFYSLLEVEPSVSQGALKKAYLKLAKKYHPDVYKGEKQDHFKRISEAYNVLKNPLKRWDYDEKNWVKRRMSQQEGDSEPKKEKTVWETIDPEFEEAFWKMNVGRMFREFNMRPQRRKPEEFQAFEPSHVKKMSWRDRARADFVRKHRERRKINKSPKLKAREVLYNYNERKEFGVRKDMTYSEIVNDIARQNEELARIDKPLMVYEEKKAGLAELSKQ